MKIKLKKGNSKLIHYLFLYLLVFMNGATFYRVNHTIFLVFMLVITAGLVLFKKTKIPQHVYLFCLFSVVNIVFVYFLNSGGIGINAIVSFCVPCLFLYAVYLYNAEQFWVRYVNIVSFLALVSCVYFVISLVDYHAVEEIMPFKFRILSWLTYSGDFFYVIRPNEIARNTGVFNEPGLYQMVLNSAIYIMLFYKDRIENLKRKRIKLFVLVVALITTMSTTGFIGLFIILLGYFLSSKKISSVKQGLILVFAGCVFLLVSEIVFNNNILSQVIFEKLVGLFDVSIHGGSSGSYRIASILISLSLLKSHPLGAGYDNLEYAMLASGFEAYEGGTSATGAYLFRYFATVGVLAGTVTLYWLFSRYKKNNKNVTTWMVAILLFVNTTLAQTDIFFPALMLPMLPWIDVKKGNGL